MLIGVQIRVFRTRRAPVPRPIAITAAGARDLLLDPEQERRHDESHDHIRLRVLLNAAFCLAHGRPRPPMGTASCRPLHELKGGRKKSEISAPVSAAKSKSEPRRDGTAPRQTSGGNQLIRATLAKCGRAREMYVTYTAVATRLSPLGFGTGRRRPSPGAPRRVRVAHKRVHRLEQQCRQH
jgi:hypothetical protein